MERTVWGTLQKNFCRQEPKKTNMSFCPKTFTVAEDKAKAVEKNAKKELRN